jgi:ligand-binding sensor domain-containing protein
MSRAFRISFIPIVISFLLITSIACNAVTTSTSTLTPSPVSTETLAPTPSASTSIEWFGTGNGVIKYDGTHWTAYNSSNSGLAGDLVSAIAIDNAGDKWFGTDSGVSKYDGISWTTYNTTNSGLANNSVEAIVIDSAGNKWFGFGFDGGGVSEFDGINWITYNTSNSGLAANTVYAIAIDSAGNKWFGTGADMDFADGSIVGGGVSEYDGIRWTTYNTSNSGLASDTIYAIAIDSAGNKWFGTMARGVSEYDGTNWMTYNASNSDLSGEGVWGIDGTAYDITGATVGAIAIDRAGNKWFGTRPWDTEEIGVIKYNGTKWTTYNTSNSGLPTNDVFAIATDNAGNIWFGNCGDIYFGNGTIVDGGVSEYDGTKWTRYDTPKTGLAIEAVFAIAIESPGSK